MDALTGHARIVINGHDHNMQRLSPVGGITPLVSGAGGHGVSPLNTDDPRLQFGTAQEYGALRLRLSGREAHLAFIGLSGATLDRSSSHCRS